MKDGSFENKKKLNSLLTSRNTVEQIKLGLSFEAMRELSHFHFRKSVPFVSFAEEHGRNQDNFNFASKIRQAIRQKYQLAPETEVYKVQDVFDDYVRAR